MLPSLGSREAGERRTCEQQYLDEKPPAIWQGLFDAAGRERRKWSGIQTSEARLRSSTYSHVVCKRGREQRNEQAVMLGRYFLYSAPRLQEKLKYSGDYSMTCHVTWKLASPLGGCWVKDISKPKRRKDLSSLAACQEITGKPFPKQCLSEEQNWSCHVCGFMHIHEGAWAVDRVQALVD